MPAHHTAPAGRAETEAAIDAAADEAADWLETFSRFLASGQPLPPADEGRSDDLLLADTDRYFEHHDLADMDAELTQGWVSHPLGELVHGHAIVLGELGLAGSTASARHSRATFEGAWTRERRQRHIVARLGYVRALLRMLPLGRPTIWRVTTTEGRPAPEQPHAFVSTTLSGIVARQLAGAAGTGAEARQLSLPLPVDRVFLTYLETRAMQERSPVAEVVLLADPSDGSA